MWGRKSDVTSYVGLSFVLASSGALAWEVNCKYDDWKEVTVCEEVRRTEGNWWFKISTLDDGKMAFAWTNSSERFKDDEYLIRIDDNEIINLKEVGVVLARGPAIMAVVPESTERKLIRQMKEGQIIEARFQAQWGWKEVEYSLDGFAGAWEEYEKEGMVPWE